MDTMFPADKGSSADTRDGSPCKKWIIPALAALAVVAIVMLLWWELWR